MAHMLEARLFGRAPGLPQTRRRTPLADDPLGAARGIVFGILGSALLFWLPLTLLFWG
jgi:hypothetical protein